MVSIKESCIKKFGMSECEYYELLGRLQEVVAKKRNLDAENIARVIGILKKSYPGNIKQGLREVLNRGNYGESNIK